VAPAATASLTATPYGNVLDGSAWSNTLIGGPGNDVLAGGPPAGTYTTAYCATNDADKLQGGNGNDWYDMGLVPACNPVIVAGTGVNLVDFSKRAVALTINLNGTASSGDPTTHPSAQEAVTIPTSMAIVLGGSAADTISVPSSVLTSTYLFGGDEGVGNPGDTITGGGGDDFIWGGTGNDTMNGGPGNDMFFERSTFQVTGASAAGDPDPLQTVAGGSWDGIGSVIYGVLDQPGSGADLVNGGSGTLDRVDLSDTTAPITVSLCADASTVVSLTTGSAWLLGCGNLTAGSNGAVYGADDNDGITAGNNYANIKWVSGGTGVVSTLSNVIIGTAADEILEGGLGLDVILGQGGNDTIYGSATGGTDPTSIDILCGGDDEDQIFGGGAAQIEGEGQMRTATGASTNVLASKAGLGGVQDPENCFGLQDTYSTDPGAGADVCLGAETVLTIGQYYDCANKTCIASVE
jgi:hypothetical protein